ncbi:MAG: large conductance mechanosensitive channel protein MscL [Pseudomonadota bacterium]
MAIMQEFKDFAVKGNVVDMGVGIVIGAAFTTIVKSFVSDIVNPIIGIFTGGIDFSNLFVNMSGQEVASVAEAQEKGLAVISYGNFINAIIAFLIVAWILFMVIRSVNKMKKEEEEAPAEPEADPEPTAEEKLLTEIRDLLAKQA